MSEQCCIEGSLDGFGGLKRDRGEKENLSRTEKHILSKSKASPLVNF